MTEAHQISRQCWLKSALVTRGCQRWVYGKREMDRRLQGIRWEGTSEDAEWLFPQVCVYPAREEVTNGQGVTWKSSLIIHLSVGLGRKGCFEERGTDGHQSERGTQPCTHTYAHKGRPVLKTASSPGCPPYATVADNLLSRPLLRNAHKHMLLHAPKSSPFYNCSTFPSTKTLSCILMCNCVYVGCEDKNLPADRNAWRSVFTCTLSHLSAHILKVKHRNHKQPGLHTARCTHSRGCDEERKLRCLSIHQYVKPPSVTTAFRLLPFHIWLIPIQHWISS